MALVAEEDGNRQKETGLEVVDFDREVDRERTKDAPGKNREIDREVKKTDQKRGKNGVKILPKTIVLHLSQLAYFF